MICLTVLFTVNMDEKTRYLLCQKKEENPHLTQNDLAKWLKDTFDIQVTQGTISNTLKQSATLLNLPEGEGRNKRKKSTMFPLMEKALIEWFHLYQSEVNMSGEILKEKAQIFLDKLYPGHPNFVFSNGWLEKFKSRHSIKAFRKFGESGSVENTLIESALPTILAVTNLFEPNNIYNMDETGLFYQMQV